MNDREFGLVHHKQSGLQKHHRRGVHVMGLRSIVTTAALLMGQNAFGSGFEPKTMQMAFPLWSIQRGLVLTKGWVEVTAAASVKESTGHWDVQGKPVDFDATSMLHSTQSFGVRYGIGHHTELTWSATSNYAEWGDSNTGTNVTHLGLGDMRFGVVYELFRQLAPMLSVATYAEYKVPGGNESPGDASEGIDRFSYIVTTTGTPDVTLGAGLKREWGIAAITGDAGYVWRLPGTPLYAVDPTNPMGNGWVKPGDEVRLTARFDLQVSRIQISCGIDYVHRSHFRMGEGTNPDHPSWTLPVIEGTEGWTVDGMAGITVNITQKWDIFTSYASPIKGQGLYFFPLDDVSPTRGETVSGAIVFRY